MVQLYTENVFRFFWKLGIVKGRERNKTMLERGFGLWDVPNRSWAQIYFLNQLLIMYSLRFNIDGVLEEVFCFNLHKFLKF